jgi:dihydroorotase
MLIKGGRIIDPSQELDSEGDLLIRGDHIEGIYPDSRVSTGEQGEEEVVDARGLWVIPGVIDMHVHLREPGFEYKETIESGCKAAAAGGITALACMPNTDPVNDHAAITRYIKVRAEASGFPKIYPVGAISRGLKGESLSEIGELKEAGVVALSNDGNPVRDSLLMRRAMEYASTFDLLVISHCEDPSLSWRGVMNEGRVAMELGLRGIPCAAEEIVVARDIILSELTGCPLHIAHVSTKGSVRLIREAKERGLKVTSEVTPHHLILTEEAVRSWDTNTKVNPPLRSSEDVEALQEALTDGTIDVIASDHAPHALVDKEVEYEQASFGISGLETMVGLTLMLVHKGLLDPMEWVRKISTNPAAILRVRGGGFQRSGPADVTLIDPKRRWTVSPQNFYSKGKNTPFAGWELRGSVAMTIVEGRIIHKAPWL